MDEETFQEEVFKLRQREWPYYLEANRGVLPAIPDLSDLSGGLSNPAQFNFMAYILWKVPPITVCVQQYPLLPSTCQRRVTPGTHQAGRTPIS